MKHDNITKWINRHLSNELRNAKVNIKKWKYTIKLTGKVITTLVTHHTQSYLIS